MEVTSESCPVCDTLEFSTGPESSPICDAPEFSTSPSREVDVAGRAAEGRRMEDLSAPSTDTPECERRCASPAWTILLATFWTRANVARDRHRRPQGIVLNAETPMRTLFPVTTSDSRVGAHVQASLLEFAKSATAI